MSVEHDIKEYKNKKRREDYQKNKDNPLSGQPEPFVIEQSRIKKEEDN